ncbi:hypothetical protein KIN20_012961 [Parelaphostrongylus tenuis]|uniref:Uncharacterized protein n=1 Tax=Parelaphostrongylus tenuis TaxID=148309 RepID=A0AAD5MCV0_PARTN|nr:hypothetical protein KIN20_012961 [Parelaphostrongylus tenuis]
MSSLSESHQFPQCRPTSPSFGLNFVKSQGCTAHLTIPILSRVFSGFESRSSSSLSSIVVVLSEGRRFISTGQSLL